MAVALAIVVVVSVVVRMDTFIRAVFGRETP
jgi:hypothetical protein